MKIFAISDLHLSFSVDKPMSVFGQHWNEHHLKIEKNWKSKICKDDLILIPGDISWAMNLKEAIDDLVWLHSLPGRKIIAKGNHDYWWESLNKLEEHLPESIIPIHNNSVKIGDYIFAGTRGWLCPEAEDYTPETDEKIYMRELNRLKLSLTSAVKTRANETLIVLLHYPPIIAGEPSKFADMIAEYDADICVYGHLHNSPGEWEADMNMKYKGIDFKLVSADFLDFSPVELQVRSRC